MFLLWEPDLCFKWKLSSNSKDTLVGRLSVRNIKEYKNETGAGIHNKTKYFRLRRYDAEFLF